MLLDAVGRIGLRAQWARQSMFKETDESLHGAGEPGTNTAKMQTFIILKMLMATIVGFNQYQFLSGTEFHEQHFPCPLDWISIFA